MKVFEVSSTCVVPSNNKQTSASFKPHDLCVCKVIIQTKHNTHMLTYKRLLQHVSNELNESL